ncbi:unnamed protein product [Aphanomyces euteiches]|uniref:VPS9 domain-containing protein n=1 Tax=Aphanomyces euteiches TaxID=100861 RepID=A0A6G0X2D4_9STRA|nr:hypothetical protein Ae201684_009195 [Aphanomyces euteiches]KAH9134084.1 hypothetical protein AeRB84_020050 [Aphanomyces euteiches]
MEVLLVEAATPAFVAKALEPQVDMDNASSTDDNQEEDAMEKDREIAFLRSQVQDLQGALKARDMELFTLQERYQLLMVAVEQQDEAIAAIYATTCGTTESDAHLRQYSALRESTMMAQSAAVCCKRTAKDMLLGHLDTMGFDASSVGTVLDALKEKENVDSGSTSGEELEILNTALDHLLYPDTPAAPPSVVKVEEKQVPEYANASTFLGRSARRPSSGRRLSVSDFGLLHVDDTTHPARRHSDPLFANLDDDMQLSDKLKKDRNDEQLEELTYAEFLERLSMPGSKDIVDMIRRFVGSVLGPRGDGCPPTSSHFVDYIFYGTEAFQQRCEGFFRSMDETLAVHPAWRHAPESTLRKARDGIEKYVMDKLADVPFHQLETSALWKAEDAALLRRMKLLATFVAPDMLDIKPCMRNEVVWSIAQDELRRINTFRAPGDKISCIVRCCSIIFSVLNLSRGANSLNRPGADDFLPVFIYLVLHSCIPSLYSNAEYIAAYRNPADLMSKAGYCFVNLRSAIEFISVVDASMLSSISPDEFDRCMADAQVALDKDDERSRVQFE